MTDKTKMMVMGVVTLTALSIPLTMSVSYAQTTKETPQAGQQNRDLLPSPAEQGGGFGGGRQGGAPAQAGPRGQGGPGQPGMQGGGMMPPGGGMQGGMGGGGGAAVVADDKFLYIVQGARVFKVAKADLRVEAQGALPRQQGGPGGPGGGPGGPGGGPGGGGIGNDLDK